MKVSEGDIERIRAAASIVEVIEGYVRLDPLGRRLVGLCPFHLERTPSFSVNATLGRFVCFGCSRSGDAIQFTEEMEHVSFESAARSLARRFGVALSGDGDDRDD